MSRQAKKKSDRGTELIKLGQYTEALDVFNGVLAKKPKDPEA